MITILSLIFTTEALSAAEVDLGYAVVADRNEPATYVYNYTKKILDNTHPSKRNPSDKYESSLKAANKVACEYANKNENVWVVHIEVGQNRITCRMTDCCAGIEATKSDTGVDPSKSTDSVQAIQFKK